MRARVENINKYRPSVISPGESARDPVCCYSDSEKQASPGSFFLPSLSLSLSYVLYFQINLFKAYRCRESSSTPPGRALSLSLSEGERERDVEDCFFLFCVLCVWSDGMAGPFLSRGSFVRERRNERTKLGLFWMFTHDDLHRFTFGWSPGSNV